MLVSNKHFTPVIGLDIHIVILFGFPIPLPHPYIGLVIDPMDYIPFIGATTKINHVPRGKSDTSGKLVFLFHIPMGGPFLLAPMIGHDSVNFFGSKKVKVEGNLLSPSGHMLMTCNDIGIPLSLQPGKKFIPIPSLYLPTSYSIPLSFGKPVMVGGPFVPDWAGVLMNLIMSYGFGALMKGLGKTGKKALTKFNHALKNKIGSNKLSKALCKKGFEPVDLVQGIVIYDGTDFELAGPLPLKWERSWNSDSPFKGVLGHGTHLCYDLRIQEFISEDATVVLLGDGRSAVFEALPFPANSDYNRHEQLLLTRTHANEYTLFDYDLRQTYTFRKMHPQDAQYRLVSLHDEAGCLISFHYNAQGDLLRVIDSAGRHLHIKNDPEGRILSVTAHHRGEQRRLVSYTYNEEGDLEGITDALDKTTYIHYRDHLMVKKTDRNGNSFYWDYDKQGRCIHTTGDKGLLEGFLEYHPREGFNRITNAQGHITTYYYTPDFVVTQIKEPMGNSIFYQYTGEMEVYREIDAEGNVTGYTYDERGNCTVITAADGSASISGFNDKGQLISRAEADGNSRTYTYYNNGLLHTLTDSSGHISIFRYNDKNLLSRIEDEREHLTLFDYDEDNNIRRIQLPDGGESSWQYDAWGNCLQASNPAGERQSFRCDVLGRIINITLPDGNQVALQYDAYDDITTITDKQYEVRFGYTPLGSMQYREENGTRVHFLYNRDEQLTGVVNEHGESYRFTRNANGDIISETGFDGITRHFELDSNGNVLKVHRPGGKWSSFEYNASNLVTRTEHSDGTWDAYTYNGADLLIEASNQHGSIRMERDSMGRLLSETQDDYTITSTYNSDGERLSLKSNLGADIRSSWSLAGNLRSISAGTGRAQPWQADIQHNLLGLEIARTLPGGLRSAWAQYENGDYDYRLPDKAGNLYQSTMRNDRQYTAGGRLQESNAARFIYDEEGNLIRKIISTSTIPVTYEYEWYGNGLLKQVRRPDQKTVQFRYDAIGRRTEKVFNGQITRYVWNGDTPLHEWSYPEKDRPHITIDENGGVQQNHPEPVPRETLTTWVFEGDSSILAAKIHNGHAYSVITDHLGTPCEAYNENGERVWAGELDIYGNVRNLEGPKNFVPFRYQGQYEDTETGLYYNRFRYYSPQEGIYISQDPIGLGGGLACYAYVHDPNAWIDILGLAPHGLSGKIIRGTDTIHSKNYTSGGVFTGKGAPNQQQALLTHTERKFLSDANDIVKSGDHLQMRGQLNPCRPGCQPAIRKFVMANKVTASYYATNTRRTYHWERISDKHLIQTESVRGKVKAKYKYNMETGRRTKIKCN